MRTKRTRRVGYCEALEPRTLLTTLVSNTTVTGTIAVGQSVSYDLAATAGDRLVLSVGEGAAAQPNFDPHLTLLAPNGTVVQVTSGTVSAFVEATAPATGTYTVVVREADNTTAGDFRIGFARAPHAGAAVDPFDGEGKVLASNTTTVAAVGLVGDIDLYTLTAAAGDRLVLSVGEGSAAQPNFDPHLTLYGPTGAVVQVTSGSVSAFIETTAATAGTYTVLVREADSNVTGDYRLTYAKVPHAGPAADPFDGEGKVLAPDTTTAAAVGLIGDVDLYTLTAAAGDRLILSVGEGAAAQANFDPHLTLYGPTGAVIQTTSGGVSAFIEVTAAAAGTYAVVVREADNTVTGDYRLSYARVPVASSPTDPADGEGKALTSNTTTAAAVGTIGDFDRYTLTAAAGDRLVLSVGEGASAQPNFDPHLTLYGPSGTVIQTTSGSVSAFIEATATAAGTYSVVVREADNTVTGDYRIVFARAPHFGTAVDPFDGEGKVLASNTTTAAAVGLVGDVDLYTLTAAAGDRLVLSLGEGPDVQANFDPHLTLYDPTGAVVQVTSGSAAAYIEAAVAAAGTYTVVVREADNTVAGEYRLGYVRLPFAGLPADPFDGDGKALVSNATTTAAIDAAGDVDLYTVSAAVGDSFVVAVGDAGGGSFAPQVSVYRPDGTVLGATNGSAGAAIDALSVTAAGTYAVVVRDSNTAFASPYALSFAKLPGAQAVDPLDGDGGTLTSGQSRTASLSIADLDVYTFSLAAGAGATIRANDLLTAAFSPQIDVFGPTGVRVATTSSASAAVLTLPTSTPAGTYYVVVRDSGDNDVGQYALALNATPGTDARPPAVTRSRFDVAAARQQVVMTLSEGITVGTLEATDLVLQNLTTGVTVAPAFVSAAFNPLSNEVTFRFPGYPGGILPDGNYRATLPAGSLADTAGNPLAAAAASDFYVLAGDANRDRTVGIDDLSVLAQNYDRAGRTALSGDFNGDGLVNIDDLSILAQNYGKSLPAPPAAAARAGGVRGRGATGRQAQGDPAAGTARHGKARVVEPAAGDGDGEGGQVERAAVTPGGHRNAVARPSGAPKDVAVRLRSAALKGPERRQATRTLARFRTAASPPSAEVVHRRDRGGDALRPAR